MKQIRVNALLDVEQHKRLIHVLVDEETTFSAWLRMRVEEYLEKKELKGKRRKGKEGWG